MDFLSALVTRLEPSVIAALVVGASAVASAVLAYLLGQRRTSVERTRCWPSPPERTLCAEAIADALQWLELPYRIRRRPDNTPQTLAALGDRINDLRERLQFHEKWLRIEIPQSVASYQRLVEEVIAAAGQEIENAWNASPAQSASDMNVGQLSITLDRVDAAVEDFSAEVVKALAWWRILG